MRFSCLVTILLSFSILPAQCPFIPTVAVSQVTPTTGGAGENITVTFSATGLGANSLNTFSVALYEGSTAVNEATDTLGLIEFEFFTDFSGSLSSTALNFSIPFGGDENSFYAISVCWLPFLSACDPVHSGGFPFNYESSALPVEYISVEVEPTPSLNTITWSTHSESNLDYFSIERTGDNQTNWTDIGSVPSKAKVSNCAEYSFDDIFPIKRAYYRIIGNDIDGSRTMSKVVSVIRDDYSSVVQPLCNLVDSYLTIYSSSTQTEKYQIFDLSGRLMAVGDIEAQAISSIEVNGLDWGRYYFRSLGRSHPFTKY